MKKLIIFALIVSYCYANNFNLKNPWHRCSSLPEAITDDPFMSRDFEIMENWQNVDLEDLPGEIWKVIPEWEGFFMISTKGRVKSMARIVHRGYAPFMKKDKILRQKLTKTGYPMCILEKGERRVTARIHKYVMLTFIGPANGLVIDHLNMIKTDNRLDNLEYVTTRENNTRYLKMISSKEVGVIYKGKGRYQAFIAVGSKVHSLGCFNSEKEAASQRALVLSDMSKLKEYTRGRKDRSELSKFNAKRKLTIDQVREVRESKLSEVKLGEKFKVSPSTIGAIRRGVNWKNHT